MDAQFRSKREDWPELNYNDWSETVTTLHMFSQVVGKTRMVNSPWTNHSWHVPLYITARGLTTSVIHHLGGSFEIQFDFIDHKLAVQTDSGQQRNLTLEGVSVATFYETLMSTLQDLGLSTTIHTTPSEIADATPFEEDTDSDAYDRDAVSRFFKALNQIDRVFKEFRASFIGKSSPVHFFWGSFDMAVTRFSGRDAPVHPGGVPNFPDWVAQEAYSHEVSSAGFWPGTGLGYAAFYSYAYPAPHGFSDAAIKPDAAEWSSDLGEFLLSYDAVRNSESPDDTLLEFLQSTYAAAADLAGWDRDVLEKDFAKDRAQAEGAL